MLDFAAGMIFTGLAFLLVYVHVGYPALMRLLAARFPKAPGPPAPVPSSIFVVLCVRNEAGRIRTRLDNLCSLAWPASWQGLVVCDGCTDDTARIATEYGSPFQVIERAENQGKPSALNLAATLAPESLLVFCDARQSFAHDAIVELLAPFTDSNIGAVSGSLEIAASESGGGQGMDLYWRLERKLREWEGQYDSVVGCTGAIYALRSHLYRPIPDDTLLDDVVIPMQVVEQGYRVVFNPRARAFDPQTLDPIVESRRKRRTLAGNFQMLVRHPGWATPLRGRIWWQLISHKYLRLTVPWLLLMLMATTVYLSSYPLFALFLAAQIGCYALAVGGLLIPGAKPKILSIPAGFVVLQAANFQAFFTWLTSLRDPQRVWTRGS
jgi:cellulose synthase/poly-beta-1,6-N-acetylglucosamine synthase-like glycosyltransferase